MEKCAFCDSETSEVCVMQVFNLLYICRDCISLFLSSNSNSADTLPSSQDNQVCEKCFQKPPSHFQVTCRYMKKVCQSCKLLTKKKPCDCPMQLFCQNHFSKNQSVVFIKIKWQSYLRSRANLKEYCQVRFELSKLKKKFERKNEEIESEIKKMKDFEGLIKKGITECIADKETKISKYQNELNILFDNIPKQIKDHELTEKYSKYHSLLESPEKRELFFKQELFSEFRMQDITKYLDSKFTLETFLLENYF